MHRLEACATKIIWILKVVSHQFAFYRSKDAIENLQKQGTLKNFKPW